MVTASSDIFGAGQSSQPLRATGRGAGHAGEAAAPAHYQDSAPRPRIVNGKIVRGEALLSVPMAQGAPSPTHATGLTWAPSPPVIRRRAADEATVAAVAYHAPPPPQQQQQQYVEERSAAAPQYGGEEDAYAGAQAQYRQGGAMGGGGGGGQEYAAAEPQYHRAPMQQQQYEQAPQQRPSTSPQLPGRGTGISHSSNRFASGANQNAGNVRGKIEAQEC